VAAHVDHVIAALKAASKTTVAHPGYTSTAPGGIKWDELASLLEDLQTRAEALDEKDPAYEYSYSHVRAQTPQYGFRSVADGRHGLNWWHTVERAEAERLSDNRYNIPTFLVARTKAGDGFRLYPEES
jgi:hypothetical protein